MRHLVVCCDGTWNTPEQIRGGVPAPTNVLRFYNAVEENESQLRYYHPGVGTGPGLLEHIEGGLLGRGLSNNIKSAYAWLARKYESGDAICLFGFSRGAFTVRSLSGMIRACGLPEALKDAEPAEFWETIDSLFDNVYRTQAPATEDMVPVEFLGVWDTVGSLGIPDSLGLLKIVANLDGHLPRFHDTKLGKHVKHARQALALDEMRGPFMPTLWSNLAEVGEDRTARQVWFPGDHCDIGGGHDRTGLSDGTLKWMIGEVRDETKLTFRPEIVDQIKPDPQDVLHDSLRSMYTVLCPAPRAIPFVTDDSPDVDKSVWKRQQEPPISAAPYRRGQRLAPGDSETVDVYAGRPWNWTGLYLEPGDYELTATGSWLDGQVAHRPDGTEERGGLDLHDLLHALATTSAWLQKRLAELNHDDQVQPFGGRRVEAAPWMALIGAVAAEDVDRQEVQQRYDPFLIGSRLEKRHVEKPGYFYAYANDSWLGYTGNRGSVGLTITRLT